MSQSIRFKDQRAEQELFQQRALAAGVVMVLALGVVVARLAWLQVVRYDYFVGEAQGNRIKVEPIPANRGLILDRNGLPLATNAPSFQLEITREEVADLNRTLAELVSLGLLEGTDAPKIAVAVVVENAPGGGGSGFASPIARKILDSYLLPPQS